MSTGNRNSSVGGGEYSALAACWNAAPAERSALFVPTFAAISLAVQTALRDHISQVCLARADDFVNTRVAYAMLLYTASRPYRGRANTEFTYEILEPASLESFHRLALLEFPKALAAAARRLDGLGRADLAELYGPAKAEDIAASVQKASKSKAALHRVLAGESALVNELIQVAGYGAMSAREKEKRFAALCKHWDSQLRRLCAGHDLRSLGPALLESASQALCDEQARPSHRRA